MRVTRRYIQIGALIILIFLMIVIWSSLISQQTRDVLTVSFLDVGQGDAIFIESPSGVQVLLDGGPDKSVLRQLGKVMSFWDRSIDIIIASHPDLDHIGGLPAVIDRFSVSYYMKPGVGADTTIFDAVERRVSDKNIETLYARRGTVVDLGGGVQLEILFPDREAEGLDRNLASIVALLTYGDSRFLLTGDSPIAIEEYLASLDGGALDSDVLKLGHHGSKTSTGVALLGVTSPKWAVISAGRDNRYGHPHREVLDRLNQFDVPYLETAREGSITFVSDGETIVRK